MAFENAEIGAVTQIVALPGIAVEHHMADAGLAHGGHEAHSPFFREHVVNSSRNQSRAAVGTAASNSMIIPAVQAFSSGVQLPPEFAPMMLDKSLYAAAR